MTKEEFLILREQGLSFSQIGEKYGLTERQVNYRTKKWGLDYSKKKCLNEDFFSGNTKAVYYWAGFLAADGYIEGDRNRVGLGLQAQDIGHLEKFKKAVRSSHAICPFMKNSAYRIRFNSEVMVRDLESRFNITPAKTFTYRLPEFEDEYLMLEFMRGYVEGDGHIEKTASGRLKLHLCSANKEFLEEFIELCCILLGRSIRQAPSLQVNKKGQVYAVTFTIQDSLDLLYLMYKNSTSATRLDRKYAVVSSVIR
jgi:LAGLIDADG-like domain